MHTKGLTNVIETCSPKYTTNKDHLIHRVAHFSLGWKWNKLCIMHEHANLFPSNTLHKPFQCPNPLLHQSIRNHNIHWEQNESVQILYLEHSKVVISPLARNMWLSCVVKFVSFKEMKMISDINADNCSLNAGLFIANCLFKSQMCKLKENLTQAIIMNFFTDWPRAQNIVTCYALHHHALPHKGLFCERPIKGIA